MGVILKCDAPDCVKSTSAAVSQGKPLAPDGWWVMVKSGGLYCVGCCDEHFVSAVKATP